MAIGFPLIKLFSLVVKQLSKPLANAAKERAKNSHFFRTAVLLPPAQFYHWCDVRMKMYVMNIGKSSDKAAIPKLNEQAAIDLGASLLGEGLIFSVGVFLIAFEVNRQNKDKMKKEQAEVDRLRELEMKMDDLAFTNEELDTRIRELTRILYAQNGKTSNVKTPKEEPPKQPSEKKS